MLADLQIFDWIMGVILLVFLFSGFKDGFIGIIIQLLGIVLAFTFIGKFIPITKEYFINQFDLNITIANILSYILLILAFIIVIKLIIILTNAMMKILQLTMLNRLVGAVLGLVAGFLFILLFVSVVNVLPNSFRNKINSNSKYYSKVENIAYKYIHKGSLQKAKDKLGEKIKKINKKMDDSVDKVKEMDNLIEGLED
ncbi:MAG: CvpA family protein [Candidatus Cloacimonadota bacterium]|nr:CvpA family protein [Candidatus Cloacimonadota bacterium]